MPNQISLWQDLRFSSCNFTQQKCYPLFLVDIFYCKYLTVQFHQEHLWLEKLLTRLSKLVSVSYASPKGDWPRSNILCPVCWMLEVSSHFKTGLAQGSKLFYPKGIFWAHIWFFVYARTDEYAQTWLSREQIKNLQCTLVCQIQISSWWHRMNPSVPWAN